MILFILNTYNAALALLPLTTQVYSIHSYIHYSRAERTIATGGILDTCVLELRNTLQYVQNTYYTPLQWLVPLANNNGLTSAIRQSGV